MLAVIVGAERGSGHIGMLAPPFFFLCGLCGAPEELLPAGREDLEDIWVPTCDCPPHPVLIVPWQLLNDKSAGSSTFERLFHRFEPPFPAASPYLSDQFNLPEEDLAVIRRSFTRFAFVASALSSLIGMSVIGGCTGRSAGVGHVPEIAQDSGISYYPTVHRNNNGERVIATLDQSRARLVRYRRGGWDNEGSWLPHYPLSIKPGRTSTPRKPRGLSSRQRKRQVRSRQGRNRRNRRGRR